MRKVFAAICVVCAVLLLAPYWFGRQAQRSYDRQLDLVRDTVGARIDLHQYRRGWFRSSAEVDFSLTRVPLRISARHRIYPGPLPANDPWGHLSSARLLGASVATEGRLFYAGDERGVPFRADTWIRSSGAATSRIRIPAGAMAMTSGGNLQWRAVDGLLEWLPRSLEGTLTGTESSVRGEGFDVTLGLTSLSFDIRSNADGIDTGHVSLAVERTHVEERGTPAVIENLLVDLRSDEADDQTASYSAFAKLSELRYGEQRLGPATVTAEVEGLDSAALQAAQYKLGARPGAPPPIRELVRAMTAHQAAALVRLRVTEPEGDSVLELRAFPERALATDQLGVLFGALDIAIEVEATPAMISRLAKLPLPGELEKPPTRGKITAMDNSASTRLRTWLDRGYLLHDRQRDRYRIDASLRQGRLRINGSALDGLDAGR